MWNELIIKLPNPHFMQTTQWAQVKAPVGWQAFYLIWSTDRFQVYQDESEIPARDINPLAACLILKRRIPMPVLGAKLSVLYAPKGPNLNWEDASLIKLVLDDLQIFARQHGAIFLKIDPDFVLGKGIPTSEVDLTEASARELPADLIKRGWVYSTDQIQFKNTVLINLASSEEVLLANMKQKTRYNVRLAEKKGVRVRIGTKDDWPMLYKMYAETSVRDGFVIRDENYYRTVWQAFAGMAEPLIAEVDGEPVAAVYLFAFAGRAYYVYGMSKTAHREKMPTYLLQWEAMKWAKARGCTVYDLWGAPDVFDESDSMWGVFRFKEGLGGEVVRTLGAWDYVPNPLWYGMYTKVVPMLLNIMRSLGRAKTRRVHEGHQENL